MTKQKQVQSESLTRQFRVLRGRIQAELASPGLVVVTSATDRDGAGATAYGLADSLSSTRQHVTLVTSEVFVGEAGSATRLQTLRRRATDRLEAADLHVVDGGRLSIVSIPPERAATMSRSRIAKLLDELRTTQDYVVLEASDLLNNSFGLLLLASADATLIAFRSGRSQCPADRALVETMERTSSKILGVVMTYDTTLSPLELLGKTARSKAAASEPSPAGAAVQRLGMALTRFSWR